MKRGDFIWSILLLAIIAFLVLPPTHRVFIDATNASPYLMGFIKFAVLATMGEFLTIRIMKGCWEKPLGMLPKAAVWGIIGMLIVLMFQVFPAGVAGAVKNGYLPNVSGWFGAFLVAFLSSAVMNLTFAPVFMATHKISDALIDALHRGEKAKIIDIIDKADWAGFIRFVVCKTIPYFWIPAHTITLLLPGEYRVLMAAFLSIALGAILAYAKRKTIYPMTAK